MSWSLSATGTLAAVRTKVVDYNPNIDHDQVEAAKATILTEIDGISSTNGVKVEAWGSIYSPSEGKVHRNLKIQVDPVAIAVDAVPTT